MSEIMHVIRNFSNRPVIRFVRSHLPVATMAASPAQKRKKEHQSSLLSQINVGLFSAPAFYTR